MIQTFTEDDEGNTLIKYDDEGIDYMIEGLMQLAEKEVGDWVRTEAVWSVSPPWWKFWDRTETPVVGWIYLKKVA